MNGQELSDRYEAFILMDKEKILAYFKRYGNYCDGDNEDIDDEKFWVSIHIMRTAMSRFSDEERLKSAKWLTDRALRGEFIGIVLHRKTSGRWRFF